MAVHLTGPEHYAEADRLLRRAEAVEQRGVVSGAPLVAAAQVHATLAVAAATAGASPSTAAQEIWKEVLG